MRQCKSCKYFRSCEGKARGKCEHPERKDDNLVYYFGGHKETNYCTLFEAEGEGGEWVKLPCKVGDILYVISQMKDKRILPFINEYEVTSISIKSKSIVVYHEMDGFIKKFRQCDFGKTIFLTREEAERAVTDINVGSK